MSFESYIGQITNVSTTVRTGVFSLNDLNAYLPKLSHLTHVDKCALLNFSFVMTVLVVLCALEVCSTLKPSLALCDMTDQPVRQVYFFCGPGRVCREMRRLLRHRPIGVVS